MFFRDVILRCLKISKVPYMLNNAKTFSVIYDKHFEYFREKITYKNSVVQLNKDLNESKVAGPEFSFVLKDHNIQTDGYFSHLMLRENVMKLTAIQVKDLLFLLANIKIDMVKYAPILRFLDEKCALSIERWPLDLSFYILDAWFIIWGLKVFHKHYYSAIVSQWGRRVNKCTKNQLILMLYYIGMSKDAPPFLMESIEDRMEKFVKDFSDEELAVACLSFFKTSKRIYSNILLKQSCKAAENLLSKKDRFNAIGILKCLRLSRFYDPKLWNLLKDYTLEENNTFNFVECTNFLAIFAAQNIYDESAFNVLEIQALSVLKDEADVIKESKEVDNIKTHPSLRSRVKDLARFLWAMASVGHNIKADTLIFVSDLIKQRMDAGEFEYQMHVLIDALQSLSLMGCYPEILLSSVLKESTLKKLHFSDRAKPRYQLYFVQKSTQIEEPDLVLDQMKNIFNPIPKSLEKDIKERKGFKDLVNILNKIPSVSFKCCYLMPHIMISGIIVSTKSAVELENSEKLLNNYKKYLESGIISKQAKDIFQSERDYICIEILDPSVCVNNSDRPLGLLKTKIRQLRELNFTVVPLSTENINDLLNVSNCNIKELLKIH